MSYVRTFTLEPGAHLPAQPLPGMRSCAASNGRCSCGWHVPAGLADVDPASVERATMDHLYGDLTGAVRRFAYTGRRD